LEFRSSGLALVHFAFYVPGSSMKSWPLIPILLLGALATSPGQSAAELMGKGFAALDHKLWEIAELHFRNVLSERSLDPILKSEATLRLAEALIREGNPREALELLEQSSISANPEVPFWRAQALVSELRFNDAISLFSEILRDPKSPHRTEAGFTQASLQLSLGQTNPALETLANLIPGADPKSVERIRLFQVEIFIDLGRIEDARQAMPEKDTGSGNQLPLVGFLEAQLQLKEGHPEIAEIAFLNALNPSVPHPKGLSTLQYHMAAIGLADAIEATADANGAAKSLMEFIQLHPDSPALEAMFSRILKWLPDRPTATDPILERIAQWIPQSAPRPISGIPGATAPTAISAWPSNPSAGELRNLQAFSLYTRAVGLHRIPTPEAQVESRRLLNRLRLENPSHFLANRALYQMARWDLASGASDLAFSILETLRETAKRPALKGQSAFLEARLAYENGDLEKAVELFDEAGKILDGEDARKAKLQEGIARIRMGGPAAATLIQLAGDPPDKELQANLELEQALSTTPPAAARTAIDDFLTKYPDHPRAPEARLAAAEATLASPEPDLSFASAQLDAIAATPEKSSSLPAARIALVRLRIADLSHDTEASITAAQSIIDNYPNQPEAAEASFTLGRNLFESGSYNPARLVLEKLATSDTDPDRMQAAWLLAARSAALGGTEASKKEAIILFDKAIETGGPVTAIASLEKARHLIDMSRPDEAAVFIKSWIAKMTDDNPLQLPAGLLLGEALFAQGNSDSSSLTQALGVYDKLLPHARTHPALLDRLQYLRGKTMEQMPDEKDPTKTREKQAFQAYHSVLETTEPPAEWEYFERCAFRALELLEKAERWQAAINVAKKIASFKSPRAEEAASRANDIRLKQQIMED
jgi:tetratricopeptide (TPR) repeat protein